MVDAVTIVGGVLIVIGVLGVRYTEAVVRTQQKTGTTPHENAAEITGDERIQITRGVGVVFTIVGFGLVVYGLGLY